MLGKALGRGPLLLQWLHDNLSLEAFEMNASMHSICVMRIIMVNSANELMRNQRGDFNWTFTANVSRFASPETVLKKSEML
jgi:hypothetical protein